MIKLSKIQLVVVIVFVVVASVVTYKYVQGDGALSAVRAEHQKSKGSLAAKLKIVEFVDFQCPSCAKATSLVSTYMEKYPGAIHIEMKYFPLRMHKFGLLSAVYAECSRKQNKFWQMHDLIFSSQELWHELEDAKPIFDRLVQEVGLDQDAFDQCLESEETLDSIRKDRLEGDSLKIRSTPSFLVNGEFVVGYKSLDRFLKEYFKET